MRCDQSSKGKCEACGSGTHDPFSAESGCRFKPSEKIWLLITNPPYGERLEDKADLPELYTQIGQAYQRLDSWSMFLITSYTDTEKYMEEKRIKTARFITVC